MNPPNPRQSLPFPPKYASSNSQQHNNPTRFSYTHNSYIQIRRVSKHNFDHELKEIKKLIDNTPFNTVSMDTEFPGVIHTSSDINDRNPDAQYSLMKSNVDNLQLIQVGLTLSDDNGNLPRLPHDNFMVVWEFAISDFDINTQEYNQESINMLISRGLDFQFHAEQGIPSTEFARALVLNNLVVSSKPIRWVTFHGAYDFGYLIKALRRDKLPDTLPEFLIRVEMFFGKNVYDIKYMSHFDHRLFGGLERLANRIGVTRILGEGHQAGSDSLLTQMVYKKIREEYFTDEDKFQQNIAGRIYPLTPFF